MSIKLNISLLTIVLFVLTGISNNLINLQSSSPDKNYFVRISPAEAYQIIEENNSNPDLVILDVRTSDEFNAGHIENAVNINYYSDNFENDLNQLDKNKLYLVYCRSGSRSSGALITMKKLGFKKVYNIGGVIDWEGEGYQLVK